MLVHGVPFAQEPSASVMLMLAPQPLHRQPVHANPCLGQRYEHSVVHTNLV